MVKCEYDPWGKCTIVSDTSENNLGKLNPFRYRGYYYDEETGFYYLQSRYYDCNICKFINADDPSILLADPYNVQCVHIYDYCENSPVINIDPEGYKYFIYSRSSALAYAAKYAWYRNKAYYNYSKTDCANFVSQCMYAAGLVMDNKWHSYRSTYFWTSFTSLPNNLRYKWDVTKAWSKVIEQHNYLMSSGYVSKLRIVIRRADLIKKVLSNRTIKIGDVMYFDEDGDRRLDHATIITNVTKKDIFYSAHTTDRLHCNLKEFFKSYKKGVAYILHFNK